VAFGVDWTNLPAEAGGSGDAVDPVVLHQVVPEGGVERTSDHHADLVVGGDEGPAGACDRAGGVSRHGVLLVENDISLRARRSGERQRDERNRSEER
jgi:hypothetical protein